MATAAVALLALALAGCQPDSPTSAAVADAVTLGPQYNENTGLLVPEDTRQSLGMRLADVTEQTVTASLAIPLRVYQLTETNVLVSGMLSPAQAKRLKIGTPIQIHDREEVGLVVTGTVAMLNNALEKATGTIEILAEFPRRSRAPALGEFIQSNLVIASGDDAITIPRSALLQSSDGYSVYAVSGEHLVRTSVKVGVINADWAEIVDGLYTGDQVVAHPVMSLWMTELAAVKGGQACCVVPAKGN